MAYFLFTLLGPLVGQEGGIVSKTSSEQFTHMEFNMFNSAFKQQLSMGHKQKQVSINLLSL